MPDLGQLPSAVRERAILTTLGPAPALVVLPESASAPPSPALAARSASQQRDRPGRALRLFARRDRFIGVDLPGHGERAVTRTKRSKARCRPSGNEPRTGRRACSHRRDLRVDPEQIAIGGMSAGGMAAAHRLVTPHPYRAMLMEASTGNWAAQAHRPMFSTPFARSVASPRPHGTFGLGPLSQCWPNTAVWTNGFDLRDNVLLEAARTATQVTRRASSL